MADNPPHAERDAFRGVYDTTLKVPAVSVEAYKAAVGWNFFENVVGLTQEEIETLGVEGVTLDNNNYTVKMFNLNGVQVGDAYKGIVIQNGKKVLRK